MKTTTTLFLAFIISSYILISAQSTDNCSTSEIIASRICWLDYFKNFGFTSIPKFADYFPRLIGLLYQNGPTSLKTVCGWVNKKLDCQKPYATDCHNMNAYAKIFNSTDGPESVMFFTTEAINNWECGVGYQGGDFLSFRL